MSGYIDPGGGWAIATYAPPDPICQIRLVCSEEDAFVLNGPAIESDGVCGDKGVSNCAGHLLTAGIQSAYQKLTGAYCRAGFNYRDGVFGFPNFTGLSLIYAAEGAGIAIVSNKPAILADILGSRAQDLNSLSWLQRQGKPTDNAFIEAFNRRFRSECLNTHLFLTLADAAEKMEAWVRYYNKDRPHGAIGNKPPVLLQNPGGASSPPP